MGWTKTLLISLIILLGAGVITTLIFTTEPEASRSGATKETAMLVDVVSVQKGTFTPTITVTGTVQPSRDIMLGSRVSGEVIDRSENFTPGGHVQKGEALLQIDSTDYINNVQQAKSELQQTEADLRMEMGRQQAAKKEYQLLDDSLSPANKALVLREPQLEAMKSQVEAAKTAVKQAQLNLERTTIKAPFNSQVLTRNINIGSMVAPGEDLARLVGLNTYWVEATVPLSKLRWLTFPDEDQEKGSTVTIRNRTAWEDSEHRTGYLYKRLGSLEGQTRMARLLVEVPDPLAIEPENENKPKLMIEEFVEANIKAKELEDVVRINRDYLRDNETVWVMENGVLSIKDVTIRFQDAEYAYVDEGLNDGSRVVTTNLSTVTDGAPLQLVNSDSSSTPKGSE